MIQYMTIYDFLKPTIRVVELFGGIGACTAALKRIKTIDVEVVDYVEKECWRLMGFKDEEFEKAEKVCLNTQLYKQAGNSIVVDVLEKILINLLKGR